MKLKALFLALAVAGAGASYALADGGHHDSGGTTSTSAESTTTSTTSTTTTQDCPRFQLRGTLVSTSATSFSIKVLKANHAAASAIGDTVTVAFTPDTRVSWSGRGTMSGPNTGDYAWVGGKQCGGDAGALTARNALFTAPRPQAGDQKKGDSHPPEPVKSK